MNKLFLKIMIGAGSLIVVALIVYGSVNLYNKLSKASDLKGQIAEHTSTEVEESEQPGFNTDHEIKPSPSATPPSSALPVESAGTGQGGNKQTEGQSNGTAVPSATVSPTTSPDQSSKEQASAPVDDEKEKLKKEIDTKITAEMEKLKASCQSASMNLAAKISKEIQADKDASLATIGEKYLGAIVEAESQCDSSFQQLLNQATAEYEDAQLVTDSMPNWKQQFDSAKEKAREKALQAITGSE
ncbi:hypothetical protein [Paenibacillus sp. GXUN7292]|uniref:hypothetical protein n=1 Tax=Paenibacillus sp. GXUN7292 TaxID=3422499 RepID=UPI003D7DA419